MKLSHLELSADDSARQQEVIAKGRDWQVRHRAQTLLYFNDRLSAKAILALQDLNIDTVYERRKNWLSKGFAFLYEQDINNTTRSIIIYYLVQPKTAIFSHLYVRYRLIHKEKTKFLLNDYPILYDA
jgi:hypothetical protein